MATKHDLETIDKAVRYLQGGSLDWLNSLTMPFIEDVASRLTSAGFDESVDRFHVPHGVLRPPGTQPPTAILGPAELLLGISIFLGTSIGSWAVGKVCDEIFAKKVRPAFLKLKERVVQASQKLPPPPVEFEFGVWYDVDEVYVRVVVELSTPEDFDRAERLIVEAHTAALEWLDKHGVTHRVLTYRIRHGELSKRPALRDTCEGA